MIMWCVSLALAFTASVHAAEGSTAVPAADIDHAVIEDLMSQAGKHHSIISHIDLTKPFDTTSQWTLVIAQQEESPFPNVNTKGRSLCA